MKPNDGEFEPLETRFDFDTTPKSSAVANLLVTPLYLHFVGSECGLWNRSRRNELSSTKPGDWPGFVYGSRRARS
jgi:hypothetical protein